MKTNKTEIAKKKDDFRVASLRLPAETYDQAKELAEAYEISLQELLRLVFTLGFPVFQAARMHLSTGLTVPIGGINDTGVSPLGDFQYASKMCGSQAILVSQVVEPALKWLSISTLGTVSMFKQKSFSDIETMIESLKRHAELDKHVQKGFDEYSGPPIRSMSEAMELEKALYVKSSDKTQMVSEGYTAELTDEEMAYIARFDNEREGLKRTADVEEFIERKRKEFRDSKKQVR